MTSRNVSIKIIKKVNPITTQEFHVRVLHFTLYYNLENNVVRYNQFQLLQSNEIKLPLN